MENSPNPLKRNTRLSFNSKHLINESPKTPNRNKKLTLNEGFETPPPVSKLNSDNYFGEESPSQDYDYSLIPMSQDVITRYRDVTWKWNDENDNQQTKQKFKKEHRPAIVQNVEKSSGTQNKIDKTKGFYKFQELLLAEGGNLKKLLKDKSKLNDDNKCEKSEKLESNFKKNIKTTYNKPEKYIINNELKAENKIDKLLQKSNQNDCNKFNDSDESFLVNINEENSKGNDIIDLLDDSDSDNLLVKLTQEIENNIENSESEGSLVVNIGIRKNNLTNIKKASHFDNDSIDELMLTLPMDEHILINSVSTSGNCDIKTSFPRHNSMPPHIQQIKTSHNKDTNTLLRHSSANCIRIQKISPKSDNPKGNGKLSPFSDRSLESISTTVSDNIQQYRKCSKIEVERKRQEAKLRRLQSQKRRELTQKSQSIKK